MVCAFQNVVGQQTLAGSPRCAVPLKDAATSLGDGDAAWPGRWKERRPYRRMSSLSPGDTVPLPSVWRALPRPRAAGPSPAAPRSLLRGQVPRATPFTMGPSSPCPVALYSFHLCISLHRAYSNSKAHSSVIDDCAVHGPSCQQASWRLRLVPGPTIRVWKGVWLLIGA